ncbi:MAG: ABC transporter ATP-binding protein [Planctomycetota bacterium]|nr:ABC transporter ATP-binding protein [Planctomycetota bacterium]
MRGEPTLTIQGLHKTFGNLVAVHDLSLEIGAGEALGLLGPNGAGKSTVIAMLTGALTPDKGKINLQGLGSPVDPKVRALIGVVPQNLALYDELTPEENLRFFGRLYGIGGKELRARVDWCLDLAGLSSRKKERVGTHSGGMKRRLNLACGLMHDPKILICDEPTVGVDPQSRNHIFDSIERLCDGGTTLLYTTHYMEEAQRLCDRVAIMDQGHLLAIDTVDALVEEHGGDSLVHAKLKAGLPTDHQLHSAMQGLTLAHRTTAPIEAVASLLQVQDSVVELRIDRPDLEQVFLSLTGRSLRD